MISRPDLPLRLADSARSCRSGDSSGRGVCVLVVSGDNSACRRKENDRKRDGENVRVENDIGLELRVRVTNIHQRRSKKPFLMMPCREPSSQPTIASHIYVSRPRRQTPPTGIYITSP